MSVKVVTPEVAGDRAERRILARVIKRTPAPSATEGGTHVHVYALPAGPRTHAHAADRADLRKDGLVLSRDDFEQLRREISASGPASDGDNLNGMAIDFDAFLGDHVYADEDPGLWQNMVIQCHPGAKWLITGRARGRREDADAVGAELARVWERYLRYRDSAGHTIETAPDDVTLRAVT